MTSNPVSPPAISSRSQPGTAPRIWIRDQTGRLLPYFETQAAESAGVDGSYVLERRVIEPGSLGAHTFDEHVLMVPLAQRSIRFQSQVDGRAVQGNIVPGTLRFLARGDSLATTWHGVIDALFLTLSTEQLSQSLDDSSDGRQALFGSRIDPHEDSVLTHLVLALHGYTMGQRRSGRLFEQSLLAAIAHRMLTDYAIGRRRRQPGPSLPAWKVRRLTDYVHDNIAGALSLKELAAWVEMSPYHVARAFRASTGKSLWSFVLECRARHALQCIVMHPESTLADVAAACGFESYSQFVAMFRKFHGILPSEYRRSVARR